MFQAVRRAAGSNPVVGSSRKTRSGVPTRGTPRSSLRLCPPDKGLTRASLLGAAHELDHLVDVARLRVVAGEKQMCLAHRQQGVQLGLLEDDADPLPE